MPSTSSDSIRARTTKDALRHLNRYLSQLNARLDVWFANDGGVLTSLTGSSKADSISNSVDDALAHLDDLAHILDNNAVIPKLKSLRGAAKFNVRRKK